MSNLDFPCSCFNCMWPIPERIYAVACRKCTLVHCQNCCDVPAGLCWKCSGVAGAYQHQRELRDSERREAQ